MLSREDAKALLDHMEAGDRALERSMRRQEGGDDMATTVYPTGFVVIDGVKYTRADILAALKADA